MYSNHLALTTLFFFGRDIHPTPSIQFECIAMLFDGIWLWLAMRSYHGDFSGSIPGGGAGGSGK